MEECIFCKIAEHKIPAQIVYEDEEVIAFKDINPVAPVHILIIPKRHIQSVALITDTDSELIGKIILVANKLASENSIVESGFRIVVNHGKNAGQSVPHVHFHLLGGRVLGWPPG
jgi:histidine triad (HIT) family protein